MVVLRTLTMYYKRKILYYTIVCSACEASPLAWQKGKTINITSIAAIISLIDDSVLARLCTPSFFRRRINCRLLEYDKPVYSTISVT